MVLEAIISDIHQNEVAMEEVLVDITKEGIKVIRNLGDLFGYGTWPFECFERVSQNSQIVTHLLGNHDQALLQLLTGKVDKSVISRYMPGGAKHMGWTYDTIKKDPKYSKLITEFLDSLQPSQKIGKVIYAHNEIIQPGENKEHGVWRYTADADEEKHFDGAMTISVDDQCEYAARNRITHAFVGHSHMPRVYTPRFFGSEKSKVLIANAGSVGIPRYDNQMRASYLIFDTNSGEVSVKRLPYSWIYARAKMIREGLPDKFRL